MFDWDRRNMNYVRSKDYAFRKNDAPVQSIDHRNCPNWSIKYVEYLSLPCNFKSNISFFFLTSPSRCIKNWKKVILYDGRILMISREILNQKIPSNMKNN